MGVGGVKYLIVTVTVVSSTAKRLKGDEEKFAVCIKDITHYNRLPKCNDLQGSRKLNKHPWVKAQVHSCGKC